MCEASTWKTTEPPIENGLVEANAAEDDCVKAARREKRRIAAAADAVRQERRRTAGLPKVGVRQKRVPMTPEQDDSIKDQHKWETVQPEKRVMKIIGQLLWVARCTRTDVSYPVSRLASGVSRWRDEQLSVVALFNQSQLHCSFTVALFIRGCVVRSQLH